MTIEAVGFLPPSVPPTLEEFELLPEQSVGGPSEFSKWFSNQLSVVTEQMDKADRALEGLALGETQNLHHVMLSLEEARLSFQLMVQVRNRVLEGYQELMRMQI